MVRLKYFAGILVALALCGFIWFDHPAKKQVKQLEGQISWQYIHANFLLWDTVEEILEWNFSQPLTDEDKVYLSELSDEFLYITGLIFSGNVVHQEWRNRMNDIQGYLNNYVYGPSLSEEDVADLHQALQATRFISMDFNDFIENNQDFYDAMHDEKHEMVERVKSRLATQY
ncbi:hypothetical protein MHH81_11075 [Psychrobacillus sp. FSL H8-0484]|uniref:hypothetical protein n=1 Tax=Psychrobacillus sp. FSL H8-0484 TaxID=2921390 RepID=UPI0030FA9525